MADLVKKQEISEPRGNLLVWEILKHIPFGIKRVFYISGVPLHGKRGEHAQKTLQEAVICLSGSLHVMLDNGVRKEHIVLIAGSGVFIPEMTWRVLSNFEKGTQVLVLASEVYDKNDYIRSYDEFLEEALADDPVQTS